VYKKLLFLLILISISFSENFSSSFYTSNSSSNYSNITLNPILVANASYLFFLEYNIKPSTGFMKNLSLNISIPENSQIVFISDNYSIIQDSLNNSFLFINKPEKLSEYNFSATLLVKTKAHTLDSFNKNEKISNVSLFLLQTKLLNYSDQRVRDLAINLTKNLSSDFEKISALAYFTNQFIDYDLSYVGKNINLDSIFSERKGVCTHYSLLFANLARALGYPTRFVHGYAYSTEQMGWVGHIWVEVYINNTWVAVDPTWLEVGFLDATHIAIFKSANDIDYFYSNINALLPLDAEFIIKSNIAENSFLASNILLKSIDFSSKNLVFNTLAFPSENSFNSPSYLIINLSNNSEYTVDKINILSCIDSDFKEPFFLVEPNSSFVVIEPKKEKYLVVKLSPQKFLDNNYNNFKNQFYEISCPISLYSNFLVEPIKKSYTYTFSYSSNLNISKQKVILDVDFKPVVELFSNQFISLNYPNKEKNEFVLVLDDLFILNNSLDPTFSFKVKKLGKHKAFILSKSDLFDPIELEFDVIEPNDFKVQFNKIEFTEGENSKLIFTLNKNLFDSLPDKFFFVWKTPYQFEQYFFNKSNLNNTSIELNFVPQTSGFYSIFYSFENEKNEPIYSGSFYLNISKKPKIYVEDFFINKTTEGFYLLSFKIKKEGEPQKIIATIDNQDYTLSNKNDFSFVFKSVPSKILFKWEDKNNNQYSFEFLVNNSNISFNLNEDFSSKNLDQENKPLYLFFIFLFLFGAILFYFKFIKNKSAKG
jgi:hypothetical protein